MPSSPGLAASYGEAIDVEEGEYVVTWTRIRSPSLAGQPGRCKCGPRVLVLGEGGGMKTGRVWRTSPGWLLAGYALLEVLLLVYTEIVARPDVEGPPPAPDTM